MGSTDSQDEAPSSVSFSTEVAESTIYQTLYTTGTQRGDMLHTLYVGEIAFYKANMNRGTLLK